MLSLKKYQGQTCTSYLILEVIKSYIFIRVINITTIISIFQDIQGYIFSFTTQSYTGGGKPHSQHLVQ